MKTIIGLLLAALLGGLGGAALAFVTVSGLLTPWARLPSPPQAGLRLLSASSDYLIITSASGELFLYLRFDNIWRPVSAEQAAAYPQLALAGPATAFMPVPPGDPLDVQYVVDPAQAGAVEYGAYALTTDGSVWVWRGTGGAAGLRAGLWLPLGGAAAGLVAGLLVAAARAGWRRGSPA